MTLTRRIIPYAERPKTSRLEIDSFVSGTSFLPPAFELLPRLLLLLEDADENAEDVAEIIRIDPNLTADILHIANSAARGGRQRTDSLSDAIIRVGLREIFRAVSRIVTGPAFETQDVFAVHGIDLWRHSLCVAIASQVLARELTDIDPEVAYTAGLLHDIGKVVLAQAIGEDYFHMLAASADQHVSDFEAENESFHEIHSAVAGRLLRAWFFPASIIEAVVHHHNPEASKEHAQIAALIYFGNIIAYRLNQGNRFPLYAADPDPGVLALLNLELLHLEGLQEQTNELFRREQERLC
jgi:putative nucleotidyltransferase with HDIG domain